MNADEKEMLEKTLEKETEVSLLSLEQKNSATRGCKQCCPSDDFCDHDDCCPPCDCDCPPDDCGCPDECCPPCPPKECPTRGISFTDVLSLRKDL